MFMSDWLATISLIFGGCCSNAITLEQLTSQYPQAGSLITFFQFIIISLHGLPKHVAWTRYGPRFKQRRIPLTPYLIQVILFYLISLLNNAAFGYRIPMAVHIIFRSGGLITSMLLGWLIRHKRYNITQILSVLLVTIGVVFTTLSASRPASATRTATTDINTYATGIGILTIALVFSGFLGVVQDWTYSQYGRPAPSSKISAPNSMAHSATVKKAEKDEDTSPSWQESMFYLHFLALPMFLFVRSDIAIQFAAVNSGPRASLSLPVPQSLSSAFPTSSLFNSSFISMPPDIKFGNNPSTLPITLNFPTAYLPLLLNTITQLVCVAGVHRLTTKVSSLSVTLVLVVRKAVSLIISVLGVGGSKNGPEVNKTMMWAGAAMVLAGTIGYTLGSRKKDDGTEKNKKE